MMQTIPSSWLIRHFVWGVRWVRDTLRRKARPLQQLRSLKISDDLVGPLDIVLFKTGHLGAEVDMGVGRFQKM
jgi:hypothetical protein